MPDPIQSAVPTLESLEASLRAGFDHPRSLQSLLGPFEGTRGLGNEIGLYRARLLEAVLSVAEDLNDKLFDVDAQPAVDGATPLDAVGRLIAFSTFLLPRLAAAGEPEFAASFDRLLILYHSIGTHILASDKPSNREFGIVSDIFSAIGELLPYYRPTPGTRNDLGELASSAIAAVFNAGGPSGEEHHLVVAFASHVAGEIRARNAMRTLGIAADRVGKLLGLDPIFVREGRTVRALGDGVDPALAPAFYTQLVFNAALLQDDLELVPVLQRLLSQSPLGGLQYRAAFFAMANADAERLRPHLADLFSFVARGRLEAVTIVADLLHVSPSLPIMREVLDERDLRLRVGEALRRRIDDGSIELGEREQVRAARLFSPDPPLNEPPPPA